MSEDTWMWDTKKDSKQAQELEKYIKEELLNKVICIVEEYMKSSETISPSLLIEQIKQVIKNDR